MKTVNEGIFYPHIFSLATAGVKHHGYQNYIFHPLKTDFIGDSGFGKSMIADMLQLVFVGAGEFKPGTEDPTRTPKNMILSKQGHSGLGYIFLNLKMSPQTYLVVGVYIETNSGRVRHFIIQAGYDWEGENTLAPFAEPLSYTATITDKKLLPIDDFIQKMENLEENHRRIVRIFNSIKPYHEILLLNHILPIDFSGDKQKLRDYAHILYSLARGKSKEPLQNDSERLKTFLFGNQDAEHLLQRFKAEDKDWLHTLQDYDKNKAEIKNVFKIGDQLQELENLEIKQRDAQEQYLTVQANYYYKKKHQLKEEITQLSISLAQTRWNHLIVNYKEAEIDLNECQNKLNKYKKDIQNLKDLEVELKTTEAENQALSKSSESAENDYKEILKCVEKLNQVETWLSTYNYSLSALKNNFSDQLLNRAEKEKLLQFKTTLEKKGLFVAFESSTWSKDYDQARRETKKLLEELKKQLHFLESLQTFSNLEDHDSLARWALNQGKSLSQIQESILLYFQGLPRHEPERIEGKRYLPDPEKLFNQTEIKGQDDVGFWLSLGGIQEFITFKSQHLSNLQDEDYKLDFDTLLHNTEAKYRILLNQKRELEQLEDLLGYESAKEPIELFKKRQTIENFPVDQTFPEQQKEFDEFILAYENSEDIRENYKLRDVKYHSVKEAKETSDRKKHQLEVDIGATKKNLALNTQSQLEENVNNVEFKVSDIKKQLEGLKGDHNQASFRDLFQNTPSERLRSLSDELLTKTTQLKSDIEHKQTNLSTIENNLQQAIEEYESTLNKSFTSSSDKSTFNYVEAEKEFKELESQFVRKYKFIVESFIKNDHYKLEGSTDIGLLAYTLIPKVFPSPDVEQINVAENVATYLESINEKNRQINQGRIDFLIDIFEKARDCYHHYLFEILSDLKKFFRGEEARITGGYQVTLNTQDIYPIDWIGSLQHNLDAWKKKQASMFNNFSKDVSLDEMVFETFKKYTNRSKSPDIRELLDPKSYFDLNFELKNAGGITKGSTGQAYTAIALLCIARLSLIEERTGNTGIRFMPIDEAEGIGSNYETLRKLARLYNYQVVSMSIRNVDSVRENEQNTYMLVPSRDEAIGINYDPYPMLTYGHEQFKLWSEERA